MSRVMILMLVAAGAMTASAFQAIPKASARALGVTRGKPFSSGAVFINGKYVAPPYVVERWGTGIRVNSQNVTGQVIDWNEFVKTQAGAKVTKQVETVTAPVVAPAASSGDDSSLDDLFDDNPKPKKKAASYSGAPVTREVVTYSLEGEFKPNASTAAMLKRINAQRTEIDRFLRMGGFICFGDSYSRVTGDARTLREMLDKLPELMQQATDLEDFSEKVRGARLVYLNEVLRADIYRNRVDYRKLMELRARLKKRNAYNEMFNEVNNPLF